MMVLPVPKPCTQQAQGFTVPLLERDLTDSLSSTSDASQDVLKEETACQIPMTVMWL